MSHCTQLLDNINKLIFLIQKYAFNLSVCGFLRLLLLLFLFNAKSM